MPDHLYERRTTALASEVGRFRTDLAEVARAAGAQPAVLDDVRLAVTEACANVVNHAYNGDEAAGDLLVRAHVEGSQLLVTVRDSGAGLQLQSRAPGIGLGLMLLRALTAAVDLVEHPGDGVEVRMAFALA